MKKALFLYSGDTGPKTQEKKALKAAKELSRAFDLTLKKTKSAEEAASLAKASCGVYDALIVAGGDGTFHNALNAIANEEKQPILGYLNLGTLGDVGKNFGVRRNLKKAIKIIEGGHVSTFDVVKANDRFFAYMAACGVYSDVAYSAKRKTKRRWGKFTYYWLSLKEAFHPYSLHVEGEADGVPFSGEYSFAMVLNGSHVGGFNVNREGSMQDGEAELYLSPKGLFHGLPAFLFRTKKARPISFRKATLCVKTDTPWCFDGEKEGEGACVFEVIPKKIRVYTSPKIPESGFIDRE